MGDQDDLEDKQFPDNDEYTPYVTAGNLAQKKGQKVTVWGKVTKVSPGDGFYIKTVDEQEILIKLKKPLTEPLEGWYEIYGESLGTSVLCDECFPFAGYLANNVDAEGHKALAKLLASLDDPWDLGDGASGMDGVTPMK